MKNLKKKRYIYIFLMIIIWILFIWNNSLQVADLSQKQSDWFMEKLKFIFNFFFDLEDNDSLTSFFTRKLAHFSEFFILSFLLSCFILRLNSINRKIFFLPILISGIIASIDETIQLFILGRSGMLKDVFIDTSGAIFGFIFFLFIRKIFKKFKNIKKSKISS